VSVQGRSAFSTAAASCLGAGIIAAVAMIGAGSAAGSGVTSTVGVKVRLSDGHITVSRSSVPTGRVVFAVRNRSSVRRDFELVGKARTRFIAPGGEASVTVRFTKAGVKRYRSSSAGAANAKLKLTGSLHVVAPRAMMKTAKVSLTLVSRAFSSPTFVAAPPGDASRLVVAQQNGLVSLIKDGVLQADPFLDLRSVVVADGEKGLLSIVFAPDYATSGLVYAYFNNRMGNIRVVEYHRSASDPDTIDRSQRRVLLALVKPTADHNGGMMQFGPDGDLYIAVGDGGADPPSIPVGATGQTLDDLFGSILRIDPRAGSPYAIPAGNPFVAVAGARPEIVAYGLRNPWRFWIDAKTNAMLIGDVGEGAREEIDRLPLDRLGLDFGWPCREGNTVPAAVQIPPSCATATLTPPLWQYAHSATRCSIIGGVVAHDPRVPALDGLLLWSDFCDGQIYALDPAATTQAEIPLGITVDQPTSFGTDALGRIYVTTTGGALYRIDPR
jgi:glucose/arabinose dehydrogenase